MIPLSGGVLFAAAVVASPALWLSLVEQTMPIDVALTRYFIVLAIAWVGAVDPGRPDRRPAPTVRCDVGPSRPQQENRPGHADRGLTDGLGVGGHPPGQAGAVRLDALEGHLAAELLGAAAQVAQPALADVARRRRGRCR